MKNPQVVQTDVGQLAQRIVRMWIRLGIVFIVISIVFLSCPICIILLGILGMMWQK